MLITLDIGGTKTLIASFNEQGKIVQQIKFKTPKDYSDFKTILASNADKFTTTTYNAGIIGIRGLIDRASGTLLTDSVLLWRNAPVAQDCQNVFNCSFRIENDSKLAGLSEAINLKSKFQKALYLTISTGIGSAFIVNSKIDVDTEDSEIGKSLFEHDGKLQEWENFASGHAIVKKYNQMAADIDDPKIWQEICDNFALGIINAALVFTPDVIILGGSVGTHYDKFKKYLQESINKMEPSGITMPPIRQAKHPEKAVVYGCYEFSKN